VDRRGGPDCRCFPRPLGGRPVRGCQGGRGGKAVGAGGRRRPRDRPPLGRSAARRSTFPGGHRLGSGRAGRRGRPGCRCFPDPPGGRCPAFPGARWPKRGRAGRHQTALDRRCLCHALAARRPAFPGGHRGRRRGAGRGFESVPAARRLTPVGDRSLASAPAARRPTPAGGCRLGSARAARPLTPAGGCRLGSAPAARRLTPAGGCRLASARAARPLTPAGGCRLGSAPPARRLTPAGRRGWRGSAGSPRAKVSRAGRHRVRADSRPRVCARPGSLLKPAERRSAKRRWAQQYANRCGPPAQASLVRSSWNRMVGWAARRVARVVIRCPWGSARGPVRAPPAAMAARAVPGHARSRSPRVTPGRARRTRRIG
jgi:hypothetical protein